LAIPPKPNIESVVTAWARMHSACAASLFLTPKRLRPDPSARLRVVTFDIDRLGLQE
jgi:hypothetical protein